MMVTGNRIRGVLLGIVALLGLLLAGCAGGGTIGTGPSALSGSVSSPNGLPIGGARITVLATGDSGESDSAGEFLIETTISDSRLELLVEIGAFERVVAVENIDPGAPLINLRITADTVTGDVTAVVIDSVIEPTPVPGAKPDAEIQQTFIARVLTKSGRVIQGAEISVRGTSIRCRSDARGECRLRSTGLTGTVPFSVVYSKAKGGFSLSGVPGGRNVTINFTLKLAVELGQVDPGTGKPRRKLDIDVIAGGSR